MVRTKVLQAIGGAALVAALAAGTATAQAPLDGGRGGPGRAGRAGGPGGLAGVPLASLNLTQAQQDQLRVIRERNRQEMQALQERTTNEILAILTAEQQARFKELQAQQGPRGERRRERAQ
jgi:Spy/CpxP family protein refolding chaperone